MQKNFLDHCVGLAPSWTNFHSVQFLGRCLINAYQHSPVARGARGAQPPNNLKKTQQMYILILKKKPLACFFFKYCMVWLRGCININRIIVPDLIINCISSLSCTKNFLAKAGKTKLLCERSVRPKIQRTVLKFFPAFEKPLRA